MNLCLRSKDAQQVAALQAFRQVGNKDDAGGLKAILQQAPTTDVVFQVYEILARAGDRSMQKEAQQLADSTDPDVRATGVFYLGWVGGAGRIAEMHKYLADGIPAVRTAAARVLAHIASPVSVGPLKEAIDVEGEDSVRLEAVKALAAIKDKEAYDALALFSRGSKFLSVRGTVVRALAESGDPAARAGLNVALGDNDPRIRSEAVRGFILSDPASSPDVWKRSLKWLPRGVITDLTRELGDKMESFLELALVHAGKDDTGVLVREEAMLALHRLPQTEVKVLFKLIERTDDDDLKIRILRQLFELDKAKVLVTVKSTALQSGVRARVAAIRMLGKYKGDKEGAELLSKFMEDTDERVRIAAALTVLGG
jgi:HEAT repeat protein